MCMSVYVRTQQTADLALLHGSITVNLRLIRDDLTLTLTLTFTLTLTLTPNPNPNA